jgi:F0F1-type ATP synthase assembly protein I
MASGSGNDWSGLSLGLYPAVGIILGMAVGSWLDHRYGFGSRGLITGAVIGLTSGMYLLFKEGTRNSK